MVRDRAWKLGFHAPVKAYVAALEGPLPRRPSRRPERARRGPALGSMSAPARWLWGNLGAYLAWVKEQPLVPALDAVEASINVTDLGLT